MVCPATPRQLEVLSAINRHMIEHGSPPTIRELCATLGMSSPNAIMGHFRALVRKGLLRQVGRYNSRGFIPVVPPGCCPCCGRPMEEP
jgi:SOS-response transcriptional repressor LexA